MVFFWDITTLKMRSLLCVETMGIYDPVTRRHMPPERENSDICCEETQQWLVTVDIGLRVGWPGDSRSRRWPGFLCAQNPGIFTTLGNTIFPFCRTLPSDGWPQCPLRVLAFRARQTLSIVTLSRRDIVLHKICSKEELTTSPSQNKSYCTLH